MKRYADIRLSPDGLIHQEHAPEPPCKKKNGRKELYDEREARVCLECKKTKCCGDRSCMKREMRRKEKT